MYVSETGPEHYDTDGYHPAGDYKPLTGCMAVVFFIIMCIACIGPWAFLAYIIA